MSTQAKPKPERARAEKPRTEKPKKEREPQLIDLGFQMRAQLSVWLFAVLYGVLLYLLLFLPLQKQIAGEPDLGIQAILQGMVDGIHLRLWPLLVVALLFASYVAFRMSLRAVRPVYRVHYALRSLAEGDYRYERFPRREEFRFLEEDMAQLNQKMKLIASRNRDILLAVNAHMEKLADRLSADEIIPRAELEEVVAAIRGQLEKAPEISLGARR